VTRRVLLAAALAVAALTSAAAASPAAAQVAYACDPSPADCSGWYRQPVRLTWSVPSSFDTEGCDNRTYATDTAGATNRCRATNGAVTADITVTVRVDTTPPVVTGMAPARAPDRADWFVRPVPLVFTGTDATSGLAGCTALTYEGPDGPAVPVTGTCTDVAGNQAVPAAFPLRYDDTAPAVRLTATPADRGAALRWRAAPDAVRAVLRRAPAGRPQAARTLARGRAARFTDRRLRNGRRYRYELRAVDAAGNVTARRITVRPGRRLLAPAAGARLAAPPVLRWTAVRGARYYNVQLFRGGRKVLSAWPRAARLRVRPAWRFSGRTRRLRAGRYRWYVWPGIGARADERYGARLGVRRFRIG
jgi:hypothetical protein